MRRILLAALASVLVGGFAHTANAVWVDETCHYVKQGYHQNVAWPWPYICPDRIAVREPFCQMINNGWRRQNLLGPHHFNPTNGQLTTAGELRVHWIVTQAPVERRAVFVERALEAEVTEQRLAAVREFAARVSVDGHLPLVSETHLVSEGRPAAVVDATNVRFYESMQPPVLPAVVGAAGASNP